MTIHFLTTSDNVSIAYQLDGSRDHPALVLSNSIGTTLHMWDNVIDELSRHFFVIRYDARGHGASGVPSGAYTMARLGQDVVELLDALDIQRSHYLGLSLGGIVGQWLGVHAANRFDRLILSNTSAFLGSTEQWEAPIHKLLQARDMKETAETFLRNWFPHSMLAQPDPVVDEFRNMLLASNRHGIAGSWAAIADTDLRQVVARIPLPTLVIAGRNDTVTAVDHGQLIANAIPGATFHVMDTVHLSNVEDRDGFLEKTLDFLAATQPASAGRH